MTEAEKKWKAILDEEHTPAPAAPAEYGGLLSGREDNVKIAPEREDAPEGEAKLEGKFFEVDYARQEALNFAVRIHEGTGASAMAVTDCAEYLRRYLAGEVNA